MLSAILSWALVTHTQGLSTPDESISTQVPSSHYPVLDLLRDTAPIPCPYPSTDGKPIRVPSPRYPSLGQILSLVLSHWYSARTKKAITQPQDHHRKGEIGSTKLLQCPTPYTHKVKGCHQDPL